MTLLYRVENEIAIEMSQEAWAWVKHAVNETWATEAPWDKSDAKLNTEVQCFANAIRSHLQHLEAEKVSPPPSNNLDLI